MIKFGYERKTEVTGKRVSRGQKPLEEVAWTEVLGVGMGQEKAGLEVGLTVFVEGLWAAWDSRTPLSLCLTLRVFPQDPIHSVLVGCPLLIRLWRLIEDPHTSLPSSLKLMACWGDMYVNHLS